jgi:hypothetical protein
MVSLINPYGSKERLAGGKAGRGRGKEGKAERQREGRKGRKAEGRKADREWKKAAFEK